jgi:hypothetical protein
MHEAAETKYGGMQTAAKPYCMASLQTFLISSGEVVGFKTVWSIYFAIDIPGLFTLIAVEKSFVLLFL